MSKKTKIFSCDEGIVVEVLNWSEKCKQLSCCGKPMVLMEVKTEDAGKEKHVPVVSVEDDKLKVKVGSVPHPMEEKHYIQWIEIVKDNCVVRQYLEPGDKPESDFCKIDQKGIVVRAFCNVHGLWKAGSSCCGCS